MRESPFRRRMEAVADIAFLAGGFRFCSDDSRKDIDDFIKWADEFEGFRELSPEGVETYEGQNYMSAIEEFTNKKLAQDGVGTLSSKKRKALEGFLDEWTDGQMLHDIGPRLCCSECDALVDLLEAYGHKESANELLESHASEDDNDDYPQHVAIRDRLENEDLTHNQSL